MLKCQVKSKHEQLFGLPEKEVYIPGGLYDYLYFNGRYVALPKIII